MNLRLFFSATIASIILILACKSPNEKAASFNKSENMNSFGLPEWAKNANIYEVNIRQYTPEGTFDAFRKHLPRLKNMGVDILWFMPIFPISD